MSASSTRCGDVPATTACRRAAPWTCPQCQRPPHVRWHTGVTIAADLEFQQLQWPAISERMDGIERLQVHLQGQWQEKRWSCDTLTIEAPHGRFALHDRAWMQADEDARRGHAAFALDVQDSQLVTRALQTLLPPALHIQGPLQITGKADGAVSRDAQQPWEARADGPRG